MGICTALTGALQAIKSSQEIYQPMAGVHKEIRDVYQKQASTVLLSTFLDDATRNTVNELVKRLAEGTSRPFQLEVLLCL